MEETNILIVEDELAIAEMVEIILRKENFRHIVICETYQKASNYISNMHYDLYIIDIMLPDGVGLDLAKQIRFKSDAPIFFLTAKESDADKIRGFMNGADDYITKPFNPLELAARVKAHMKRYTSSFKASDEKVYKFGHFLLDKRSAELTVNGEKSIVTGKLFHLLLLFCENAGQILSKEQIFLSIWGEDSYIDDNTIMVHIRRLREKIEQNPSNPKQLITIRGIGYKLVNEEK